MNKHFLFWLFILLTHVLVAQESSLRIPGQIVVQLEKDASINTVLSTRARLPEQVWLLKQVSEEWNIFLLGFEENELNQAPLLAAIKNMPGVRFAGWNERIQERNVTPNDVNWGQQSDMRLINALEAWDASTGGLTPQGDTIVIAILEKGIQLTHPDLIPNLWANRAEIPGNQKDDDGNGFVDDYQGYDVRNTGSGPGNGGSHGTSVSAIAGARGNNITGVTGVNWHVKLMPITNVDALTEVVAGYEYALKMRRLYNSSGGKKGAFIVCTNSSFGRDNRFPSFFPAWCEAYESLGNEGVLSAGATTNSNSNVDTVGDLPSTCESEYLMVVTNVTSIAGNKATQAGFGARFVDLGAPGDGTFTAENGPTYGTFEGTSAATPHVAGAIALTYSFNCNAVSEDRLSNPAACARRVRDLILDNVVPNTTLSGITTTGGRLDLSTTLAAVRGLCQGAIGPLQVLKVETDAEQRFKIFYQAPSSMTTYRFRVFNMLGQLMYEMPTTPKQFEANIIEFDANILPNGIYVFSLNAGNNIISRKFAKF